MDTSITEINIAGHIVKVTSIEGRLRIILNEIDTDAGDGITVMDASTDGKKLIIASDKIIRTDATTERMMI